MDITLGREQLKNVLEQLAPVVNTGHVQQIYTHILFDIRDGVLTATASTTELQMQVKQPVDTQAAVSFTAPARKLLYIARDLKDDTITLSLTPSNKQLRIAGARSKFLFSTLSPEQFDVLPIQSGAVDVSITTEHLKHIIDHTVFATSDTDSRIFARGIHFDFANDTLTAAATDTHRLCVCAGTATCSGDFSISTVLPRKAAQVLSRLYQPGTEPETVRVHFSRDQIAATVGDVTVVAKLLDTTFPVYQMLLEQQSVDSIDIDRQALIHALKVSTVLSAQRLTVAQLEVSSEHMAVRVEGQDGGETAEMVLSTERTTLSGDAVKAEFNAEHLSGALLAIDSAVVSIAFIQEGFQGCIVQSVDGDNEGRYLLAELKDK